MKAPKRIWVRANKYLLTGTYIYNGDEPVKDGPKYVEYIRADAKRKPLPNTSELFLDLINNQYCSCGGWKCKRCKISIKEVRDLLRRDGGG